MKDVEERLREAYRAAADTVQPDAIRALHQREIGSRRRTASGRPHRRRMLAPVAAAAVTATVAIGASVAVPALTAHHARSAGHHGGGTARSKSSTAAASLPEFVIENNGGTLQVVATATWKAVGQVSAPAGQSFEAVAGAADDRTFVVAADLNPQTTCAAWLYMLHLNSHGQPGNLIDLARSRGLPTSIAISADGTTVGYSIVHCAGGATGQIAPSQPIGHIGILNVAQEEGTLAGTAFIRSRAWSFSLAEDYTNDLSLSGNGYLIGFSSYLDGVPAADSTPVGRVLSAAAQSGTVQQRARILVRPAHTAYAGVDSVALSSDGHTMYACTHSGSSAADITQTVGVYDTATGALTGALRTWHTQDLSCSLTADPAGGHLLLATTSKAPGSARAKGYVTTNTSSLAPPRGGHPTTVLSWIDVSTGAVTTLPLRLPVGTSLAL